MVSNPERYRRLVGKLNYLTVTRPDISFPVSVVSQFMTSPCDSHWEAVVRILRYIKSAPGKGLLFEDQGHEHIIGYTDADWAGSPSDRRSTSGYCVLVGGTKQIFNSWPALFLSKIVRIYLNKSASIPLLILIRQVGEWEMNSIGENAYKVFAKMSKRRLLV
ncbi:uncharacterized mitochondrial protein AtMg00240-like [Solanum tuberosum]|uniref:uncharacterized mitochondrial protein AtMg00240-like n=1 Tax=Solanum tuberosum TaxID=4113 RepID=UPI00073A4092|nr:PREDICTED: uncharacterized mitochondrial protein AtMg00240-like [Solanum tuberosum]